MQATFYHHSKHLRDDELALSTEACPLCGDHGVRESVGRVQDNPTVDLLRCSNCLGCSVSRMPTPPVLDDYYNNYYTADGPKITFAQIEGFVSNLLQPIDTRALGQTIRILDFGGGDGTLCCAVAKRLLSEDASRAIEITLVDYQPPTDFQDDRIRVTHHPRLEEVQGEFDLILASAILEHIPDFQTTARNLLGHLAPGGWFYARTPYMAPFKRVLRNLDLTFPAHVHDLGAPFWNRLPKTLALPLRIAASRPSIIESDMKHNPMRTIIARLMKFPARLELALLRKPHTPLWRFVGGWEVVMQREPAETIL